MDVHPLKAFQDREKLSQGQLAKLLGKSRPTITRWLNGTRKPDEKDLPSIAEKTGILPREMRPDLASIFTEAAE